MKILLGVTGSVATIKLDEMCSQLTLAFPDSQIKIVATKPALHFIGNASNGHEILTEDHEWDWQKKGDTVLHIEVLQLFHQP